MPCLVRSDHDELLIVFAREPAIGRVKTRLAAASSDLFALQVYQRLLARTLRLARSVCRETSGQVARSAMIAFDDARGKAAYRPGPEFLASAARHLGASLWQQPEADLGGRMQSAFDAGFAAGAQRIVLIGCDTPTLSWRTVSNAFEALRTHRMSIAPTTDGGYCLIGLSQPWPELFDDMQWSHDRVYQETIRRAQGEPVFRLKTQRDIDDLQDWADWTAQRKNDGLAESISLSE